jgi:hypothetical protein
VTSPIAKTAPPTQYDQVTWLGIASRAITADEFTKVPLLTIPLRPRWNVFVRRILLLSPVRVWIGDFAVQVDHLETRFGRQGTQQPCAH